MAAKLKFTTENTADVMAEYAELFNNGVLILEANTSCTSSGVFAINCTSYLVCTTVKGGFIPDEGTCPPQQNFDPINFECSSSYVCPSCDKVGFFCTNRTSFTFCAGPGVEIASNQPCPSGYYCNDKCSYPCLNNITLC
jgi:hypothetical protein